MGGRDGRVVIISTTRVIHCGDMGKSGTEHGARSQYPLRKKRIGKAPV